MTIISLCFLYVGQAREGRLMVKRNMEMGGTVGTAGPGHDNHLLHVTKPIHDTVPWHSQLMQSSLTFQHRTDRPRHHQIFAFSPGAWRHSPIILQTNVKTRCSPLFCWPGPGLSQPLPHIWNRYDRMRLKQIEAPFVD